MWHRIPLLLLMACGPASMDDSGTSPGTTSTLPGEPPVELKRSQEEAVFPSTDLDLEGLLTLPKRLEGEPVPAVVLIHGSGPNSRHVPMSGQLNMGFGTTLFVFDELANALAKSGVAVLQYDKRTCFSLNGCSNSYPEPSGDILVQDFIDDAAAAVDFLRTVPDIDPGGITVVGHSQGASFIPEMLNEDPDLAGGVMVAGGFRPIDELLQFQLDSSVELLEVLGYTTGQITPIVADLQQWVDDLEALRAGTFTGTEIAGVSVAFWEDWLRITDEAPQIALSVEQPMTVFSGDYDWNVPPEETLAWEAHLDGLGHTATVLPCVTHALNCLSEPNWMLLGPEDIGVEVDPSVHAALLAGVPGADLD